MIASTRSLAWVYEMSVQWPELADGIAMGSVSDSMYSFRFSYPPPGATATSQRAECVIYGELSVEEFFRQVKALAALWDARHPELRWPLSEESRRRQKSKGG